jgi:hypothetical protein
MELTQDFSDKMVQKELYRNILMERVSILNKSGPVKLLGIIAGVIIVNIAVLSPGLLDVEIGGDNPLETASGVTLLFISLLVVLYGSYSLLFKPRSTSFASRLETHVDYVAELNHYNSVKVLKNEVSLAQDQLERLEKKKNTLLNVLTQRFDPAELSFRKFNTVINEVEKLFYLNIRGVLNKLNVFDASEYAQFADKQKQAQFSSALVQKKSALYSEFFSYVTGYLGANEEILLKLDQLLLEISQLDNAAYESVEEMPCMKELTALIKQTKLYQQ